MGDLSSDWTKFQTDIMAGDVMTAVQDTFMGVPAWAILAGVVLVLSAGGSEHSYAGRGRRAARAASKAF